MKKYITLAALLVAGAAFTNAADKVVNVSLPAKTDFTWIAGSNASGIGTTANATIIKQFATIADDDLDGWFGGTGQAYGADSYGGDISITSTNSFTFTCRPALSGEYVAVGLSLDADNVTSITLSFKAGNMLGYSLWSWDATAAILDEEGKKVGEGVATELIAFTEVTAGGDITKTCNLAFADIKDLFVVWSANPSTGNAGGGTGIAVSNISLSYIPEPSAFGLLAGLGALALVGTRRRRK